MVSVFPFQCHDTNALRLPLYGTSFFGDHRGIVFGKLSCMVFKNLAHRCPAPRLFRLCRRKPEFCFFFNDSTYSWELKRSGMNPETPGKSAFSGVIMTFPRQKPVNACSVMLLCVNPSAGICFAGSGSRSTWLLVINRYFRLFPAFRAMQDSRRWMGSRTPPERQKG